MAVLFSTLPPRIDSTRKYYSLSRGKLYVSEKNFMKLLMGTKPQFKMYLDQDLIDKLDALAARTGRRSGQAVAEEVIDIYLPAWTATVDAMRRAVTYQTTVQSEIADLGTVDEFDLDARIRTGDGPASIMQEWFAREKREYPEDFGVLFSKGWDSYSVDEKRAALVDAKRLVDRNLKGKKPGKIAAEIEPGTAPSKADLHRMINSDEIAEAERRLKPRKRKNG